MAAATREGWEAARSGPAIIIFAAYLDAWIDAAGIAAEKKGPLFRAIRKGNRLTENPMARSDVLVMIKRRAEAAALPYSTCCHTFRATGSRTTCKTVAHLNTRSRSRPISRRARPSYDRTQDEISLDEVERIRILHPDGDEHRRGKFIRLRREGASRDLTHDNVLIMREIRGREGMDAFEQIVSEILWMEGYWVRTSVKVQLTKEEKRKIGRPSTPRWELDIVAYRGRDNLLRVIECKSYLDSRGVVLSAFDGSDGKGAERYKLFADEQLRSVVFERLRLQFAESGACGPNAEVKLCLACGRIATDIDRTGLHKHLAEKG